MTLPAEHRIAVLALDGVAPLEVGITFQVFDCRGLPYELVLCGRDRGPVATDSGWEIAVTHGLDAVVAADTVIVPAFRDYLMGAPDDVAAALRGASARSPDRVDLHCCFRARFGRVARRTPRDHALAVGRGVREALPGRGSRPGRAVRRQRRHPHVGGRRQRYRPVPAPAAPRGRSRGACGWHWAWSRWCRAASGCRAETGVDVGHAAHGGLVAAAHLGNESAAWNVAVGIGLLWAALRPSAAAGLLPALGGFVVVLGIVAGFDLSTGQVAADRVASHTLVVAGVALLFAVRRQHARQPAPPSADRVPAPEDGRTGRSDEVAAGGPGQPQQRRFPQLPTGRRAA